jgi:hypothetical protein
MRTLTLTLTAAVTAGLLLTAARWLRWVLRDVHGHAA